MNYRLFTSGAEVNEPLPAALVWSVPLQADCLCHVPNCAANNRDPHGLVLTVFETETKPRFTK